MRGSYSYKMAKRDLCQFLEKHSLSSNIAWVFGEDLAWVNRRLNVRSPLPKDNETVVASIVESARVQELGVELKVVAKNATTTFCGIIVPADEREAEELMINGIKISVPERLLEAFEVTGPIKWRIARMMSREPSPISELLLRGKR